MADTVLRCRSCGVRFLYTDVEQRKQALAGVSLAQVCPGCQALQRLTQRYIGHIKWYAPRKGFGFVAHDDGRDLFVHVADLADSGLHTLRKGQQVSYRLALTDKGMRAVDVQLISPSDDDA